MNDQVYMIYKILFYCYLEVLFYCYLEILSKANFEWFEFRQNSNLIDVTNSKKNCHYHIYINLGASVRAYKRYCGRVKKPIRNSPLEDNPKNRYAWKFLEKIFNQLGIVTIFHFASIAVVLCQRNGIDLNCENLVVS